MFVSLLDEAADEDEEEAADEEDEQPVLFIHSVCRLSLPSSYGSDVAVVLAVAAPDLSVDLSLELDSSRRRTLKSLDRLVLNAHTRTPTISTTETAPMNEPNRVCLSSEVVRMNEDAARCSI